uniref:COP9 signalosome complex subunit 7a n=1 Tax=Magallana gigas TaxID=29159 RepID=K1QYT7_MAGGI
MTDKATPNPLEQFVLLAKTAKGAGAVELIKQALDAQGVYVFGELLDMPHIQELASGAHSQYFNLLNIFAYGCYKDYKVSLQIHDELCICWLKIFSIILNDLIIEVIYADIVHGKLDQKNQQLEVDYALGRDIRPEAVPEIVSVLQDWCTGCEAMLQSIETQISKANQNKENNIRIKHQIEQEVVNIKKTLKNTQQQDSEEQMVTDSQVSMSCDKPSKKSSKTKGLRGSGSAKLWK